MEPEISLPYPILNHMNSVHNRPSHFCEIHFNRIVISKPRSTKFSLYFKFSDQNVVQIFSSRIRSTCTPYYRFWFDDPTKNQNANKLSR